MEEIILALWAAVSRPSCRVWASYEPDGRRVKAFSLAGGFHRLPPQDTVAFSEVYDDQILEAVARRSVN